MSQNFFKLGGGGGFNPDNRITITGFSGSATFDEATRFTVGVQAGGVTVTLEMTDATEVIINGNAVGPMTLTAPKATSITLKEGDGSGPLTVTADIITSMSTPSGYLDTIITAPNLVTIPVVGTPTTGAMAFWVKNAALDEASVQRIITACADSLNPIAIDITGGSNAAYWFKVITDSVSYNSSGSGYANGDPIEAQDRFGAWRKIGQVISTNEEGVIDGVDWGFDKDLYVYPRTSVVYRTTTGSGNVNFDNLTAGNPELDRLQLNGGSIGFNE